MTRDDIMTQLRRAAQDADRPERLVLCWCSGTGLAPLTACFVPLQSAVRPAAPGT